jgi:hypothetical protein
MAKLTLIELNEFNPDMLARAAAELNLRHVARLLAMPATETFTNDEQEHQGLDPWVQWVSIHSGQPTEVHGIRRLGMTARQNRDQLWNAVGKTGRSWGAWGVMNAPLGSRAGCDFFMPDPWSFEERAFPPALNNLLALPRYAAKNYLKLNLGEVLKALSRLAVYFVAPARWPVLPRIVARLFKGIGIAGLNIHTLTTLVDYIGVLQLVQLKKSKATDFTVVFLNHIAHLQHQFWSREGAIDPNMRFGLLMCDEMLGLLFASLAPGEAVVVANGMRQKNVAGQGWCVYRQKQPEDMLRRLGVDFARVEQCMTNDANVIFADAERADRAMETLSAARLGGTDDPIFYAERESPTRLFYQLAIDHRVSSGATIVSPNGSIPFDDVLELVCERTGAHEQRGDVFAQAVQLPERMQNHELFDAILGHFRHAESAQSRVGIDA